MENESLILYCGEYPENFISQDISSDPNFVFTNDPDFPQTMLWDIEGNWVYVNSFVECEHYYMGGWNYEPPKTFFESIDLNIFSQLLIGIMILYFSKKIYQKKFIK